MLIPVAPPVPAPSALVKAWESITVEWVGADGSRWDLGTGAQGVVLSAYGTEGMHEPVIDADDSETLDVDGAQQQSWRAPKREVFWPIRVFHDDSLAWKDTYQRFFDSLNFDRDGIWRVGFNGETRELRCRFRPKTAHRFDTHPTVLGWGRFGVELVALQPWWEGELIRRGPWKAPDTHPFFPGPPYYLSASSAFGSATVPNPGQVPVWRIWVADGPLTSLQLGDEGRVIDVPFAIPAGKRFLLDTNPRNVTAVMGDTPAPEAEESFDPAAFVGEDKTEELGFQSFTPTPIGAEVPVHVSATGAGRVQCLLTPRYRRAM